MKQTAEQTRKKSMELSFTRQAYFLNSIFKQSISYEIVQVCVTWYHIRINRKSSHVFFKTWIYYYAQSYPSENFTEHKLIKLFINYYYYHHWKQSYKLYILQLQYY